MRKEKRKSSSRHKIFYTIAIILIFSFWYLLPRLNKQKYSGANEASLMLAERPPSVFTHLPPSPQPKHQPIRQPSPDDRLNLNTVTLQKIKELRSEARSQLAINYSAQKAFFAEYNRYSTDLMAIGTRPDSTEIPYKFGFLIPFNPAQPADSESFREQPNRMSSDDFIGESAEDPDLKYKYTHEAESVFLSDYAKYCEVGCTADENGFEMLIVVPLLNTGRVDVWRINQRKEIVQVQDGTLIPTKMVTPP